MTARQYYGLLVTYLKPQWRRVLLLAVLLLTNIGLQLANPQLLAHFIDIARSQASLETLRQTAGLFLVVVLLGQLVALAVTYLGETVGWFATDQLREDLAIHCLRLPLQFHNAHTPGEMIERVDGDVAALSNFFSRFVVQILGNLLLFLGILGFAWLEDWRIGLLLSAFTLVSLLVLTRIRRVAVPAFKAHRQGFAELTGFWEERLTGTEDLRANGALPYTMHRHFATLSTHMHNARRGHVMARVLQSAAELLLAVGTAAAFAVSAYVLTGSAITLGTVYVVFAYTNVLAWNLLQLAIQLEDLQRAIAAIERIRELIDTPQSLVDGIEPAAPSGLPSIEFEDVAFSYTPNVPILSSVSFQLRPGAVLGLLGRSGSGKTTLARLIFRFYDAENGSVKLDNRDVRLLPLSALRRRIGIVTQEVQIFQATLRDNLTLFDPLVHDEQILDILHQLGLSAWYHTLPNGLETRLVGGAGGLSAGEAQLVAFARIFLQNPGLIILDEASSRLDPTTEVLIGQAIERLITGRTAIIIAHRLQTVQRVDEIMILEDGQVVEHGARKDLQADLNSRFAQLLRTGLQELLV